MTLIWTPVFAVLMAEVLLCVLLLLPFGFSRRMILALFDRIFRHEAVRTTLKVVLVVLCLSFAAVAVQLRNKLEHKKTHDGDLPMEEQFVIFYEERNAILLGFTVFLAPLIWQFIALFASIRDAERAEAAAAATGGQPAAQGADPMASIEELTSLTEQIDRLKTAQRSGQALASQVASAQREIERLHAENERLQQQLQRSSGEQKKDK